MHLNDHLPPDERLSRANLRWLSNFQLTHHRKPTVLHIGNIANNAYNNARLLNQVGLDCDVICYDYYHTMACPEWEDADFQAAFKNDNHPAWLHVNLQGFERPSWFAQGKLLTCISYLNAKRAGLSQAGELWKILLAQSRLADIASDSVAIAGYEAILQRLSRLTLTLIVSQPHIALQRLTDILAIRIPHWMVIPMLAVMLVPLMLLRIFASPFKTKISRHSAVIDERLAEVLSSWKQEFPDRADSMCREDLLPYGTVLPAWAELMSHYDFVIGYSTDPLLPMLAGKPYFALEHGTLREIPYLQTPIGRLCALSYRKAQHVFVTNFDCIESAKLLAPDRFTVINHPYDEDHGLAINGAVESRTELTKELESTHLIFHPTRHDWVKGTGYADKSNDLLIRAFIKLRRAGIEVGMICCTWGKNVDASRAMVAEAGLSRHVKWVAPLPITPFERMCRACDVVADQFKLGSFGGVCFKALAVGAPILTYLDESLLLKQYPEVPPVINCQSTNDIVSKLTATFNQPEELIRLSNASRNWIKKHHNKAATINAQIDQFRSQHPMH